MVEIKVGDKVQIQGIQTVVSSSDGVLSNAIVGDYLVEEIKEFFVVVSPIEGTEAEKSWSHLLDNDGEMSVHKSDVVTIESNTPNAEKLLYDILSNVDTYSLYDFLYVECGFTEDEAKSWMTQTILVTKHLQKEGAIGE